jgi:hypothetical protein
VRIEPRLARDPLTAAHDPNAYISNTGSSRGEKRKEESNDTPSPSLVLAQGLYSMLNGDVLHPFNPQYHLWDDLWLEQNQGAALREFKLWLLRNEFSEIDKAAVKKVCAFFMNLKKKTRLFQQRVDWKNPSSRIRSVTDQANRATTAVVSYTLMRKGNKQQRRSSAGICRDTSDSLPGLAVEWNVDADSSWVRNENHKGTAMNDPKLLTRLLQKSNFLPDEDDYLRKGKKVLPVEVLTSAYKKFLTLDNSFSVQTVSYKSDKGKGKGKPKAPEGKTKARWLSSEATGYDLLMLPHPDLVNREDGTYLVEGPGSAGLKVVEHFPSSYLSPVPTLVPTELVNKNSSKKGAASVPSFPRSTITGTVEDFQILLRASPLSKQNKIPAETYRALSLDLSSEASGATDKATAPKRISAFLRLCAAFIPWEHAEYDEAVEDLNAEVDDDVESAKLTLENFRDDLLPAIVKAQSEAVLVLHQVLYALPSTGACALPRGGLQKPHHRSLSQCLRQAQTSETGQGWTSSQDPRRRFHCQQVRQYGRHVSKW